MPDSTDLNALYGEWLEIPSDRLPPNHYALLGIPDFESDEEKIEAAAKSRSAYLHQIASGPQRRIVQEMLGQVAIARRTLLNPGSRAAYDESLRGDAAGVDREAAIAGVAAGQPKSPPGNAVADQEAASAGDVRRGRARGGDWKYHAISAAVLLVVVGTIYWFNRHGGGRRAAQAIPVSASEQADSTVSDPSAGGPATAVESSPPRKLNVAAARQLESRGGSSSPIAKPRKRGSGLGSGLGAEFEDVLSDIAGAAGKTEAAGSPDEEGIRLGEVVLGLKETDLPAGLVDVAEFPSRLSERFEVATSEGGFEVEDQTLVINEAAGDRILRLKEKQFRFKPGSAVALTSSLSSATRGEARVGVMLGPMRMTLRSRGQGVELLVRPEASSAARSVHTIPSQGKPTRLLLERSAKEPESIQWFIKIDDQICSGTVTISDLAESPEISILVTPPQKASDQKLGLTHWSVRQAD